LGFGEEYCKKIYNFKSDAVDFLLKRIIPKHTIKTVMTLLLTTEQSIVNQQGMVEIIDDVLSLQSST
jgi:hypothetical protein